MKGPYQHSPHGGGSPSLTPRRSLEVGIVQIGWVMRCDETGEIPGEISSKFKKDLVVHIEMTCFHALNELF